MTALWGSLEQTTVIALGKLAGYDELLDMRAVIITAHMNFQQRVEAISALCEQLAPEHKHLAGYPETIKLLKAAQKARNKLAHNGLSYDENAKEVGITYATARGSLKLHMETVRLADVQEASAKVHEAHVALHTLITGKRLEPVWART